jgi:hypothetical protein
MSTDETWLLSIEWPRAALIGCLLAADLVRRKVDVIFADGSL